MDPTDDVLSEYLNTGSKNMRRRRRTSRNYHGRTNPCVPLAYETIQHITASVKAGRVYMEHHNQVAGEMMYEMKHFDSTKASISVNSEVNNVHTSYLV